MSFMFAVGRCISCNNIITFNASKVPSIRPSPGEPKEPLCRSCFELWNEIHRTSKGLEPIPLQPGAYEAEEVS